MKRRLRVALETQYAVGRPTGLGVYAAGLANALRAREDVDLVELIDPRFDLWRFDRRVLWDQLWAPRLASRADADVVHFTGGTLPARTRRPVVLTMHDLVWLRGANPGRFYVRWYFGAFAPRLARRADALVVDTEAAKADVVAGLGVDQARVFVAGIGVDASYFPLARHPDDPPFALSVGTVERRKDLATAVRALARVPGLRLVSAGPFTPYVDEVRAVAAECGVSDRVELRGYVEAGALADLYSRAAMLAFPSRYEGFGLPPLQALACGLPVVAARISVVAEVLGDCAEYVEPGDVDGFAAAFQSVLAGPSQDRIERGRARARTFTWAATADRVMRVYEHVVRA